MRYRAYVFIVLTISLFCINGNFCESDNVRNEQDLPDWDYLMFSQRWTVSACVEWEGKAKNNTCKLPLNHDTWLVHGLWPTKNGTKGPISCKSAIHFDPDQLQPLINDLNEYWTNIEANTKPNSFWSHEWDKHGTCASSLPQLNSVYNYFHKGLELRKEFDIFAILSDSSITPNTNNNYTVEQISNAIQKKLLVTPQIQCVVDSKTKESLLSEIRVCFDKNLKLINCPGQNMEPTNCSKKKPVEYWKDIPGEMAEATVDGYFITSQDFMEKEEMLEGWYILIKFLSWFTL